MRGSSASKLEKESPKGTCFCWKDKRDWERKKEARIGALQPSIPTLASESVQHMPDPAPECFSHEPVPSEKPSSLAADMFLMHFPKAYEG